MGRARNPRGEGQRLREEIVEAATQLLAGGDEGDLLSLRAVAREVGIAPQSMYLHFGDKAELVLAVVERRFGELLHAGQEACSGAESAADRLRAWCLAYCQWGLQNPGHYRLLFESRTTGLMGVPYEGSPGAHVFDRFVAMVRECIEAGAVAATDPFDTATDLWVGLHGIVSLRLSKPGFPWPPVETLVGRVVRALAGLDFGSAKLAHQAGKAE